MTRARLDAKLYRLRNVNIGQKQSYYAEDGISLIDTYNYRLLIVNLHIYSCHKTICRFFLLRSINTNYAYTESIECDLQCRST